MSVQNRIRQRLDTLGLSMKAASIEAGLGETAIKDLLKNEDQSPRLSTLEKLAPVLGTSVEWLASGTDTGSAESAQIVSYWDHVLEKDKPIVRSILEKYAETGRRAKDEEAG